MTQTRFSALSEAFDRIVALPAASREEALAALPDSLRDEVERLLRADSESEGEDRVHSTLAALGDALRTAQPGSQRLGPWRVLHELGAGGMGTVFLAERADGQFEQQAAIKLIRGFPTEDGRRRLRQERQILAQLDHPGIARLLDGGETADGQPWVAMEYVEGLPVVAHVARYAPDLQARLALFDRIAAAVEHAHQRLVIHRDLKPANVLVRADGEPKLLDFGVAKLIDLGLDSGQRDTSTRVWTPGYASPEQRHGQPITTASDVYALGVLLRDMLEGDAAARARGGFPALPADAELRGVIAMATAEAPGKRYPTVEALREELRRYRRGRPLRAAPDTRLYRARKFIGRHRLPVALALLTAVLLVGFIWRLQVERADALAARARADAASQREALQFRFLATVFMGAAARREDGSPLLAVDLIDRARERLGDELGSESAARAQVERMLGSVYLNAGRNAEAEAMYRAAAEHGEGHMPDGERAAYLREAARAAEFQHRSEEALRLLDQAEQLLGPPPYDEGEAQTAARILLTRILVHKNTDDPRYPETVAQAARLAPGWLPAGHPLLALILGEQAAMAEARGEYSSLVAQRRAILDSFLRAGRSYPSDIGVQRMNLVRALALTGDHTGAREELQRAAEDLRRAYANADNAARVRWLLQSAQLHLDGPQPDPPAALADAEAAMAMLQRLGEDARLSELETAADAAQAAGAVERAREWLQQALTLARTPESQGRLQARLQALDSR